MDLLEKNNEEKFEDSEFEKTEMNEDLEREKNEEAAKDILIEELEEENKMLYKRGVLLTLVSLIILIVSSQQSYREGQKKAMTNQNVISEKVYDTLENEINSKLKFPFRELLSQFNFFEKYLFDNYEIIDTKEYDEKVVPIMDEFFEILNFGCDNMFPVDESNSDLVTKAYVYK